MYDICACTYVYVHICLLVDAIQVSDEIKVHVYTYIYVHICMYVCGHISYEDDAPR